MSDRDKHKGLDKRFFLDLSTPQANREEKTTLKRRGGTTIHMRPMETIPSHRAGIQTNDVIELNQKGEVSASTRGIPPHFDPSIHGISLGLPQTRCSV
jgi:hypothetical protein